MLGNPHHDHHLLFVYFLHLYEFSKNYLQNSKNDNLDASIWIGVQSGPTPGDGYNGLRFTKGCRTV